MRALLVETWHATYDAIYGADRVTEITDDWHSIASLKARLVRPNSEFLVADDGKRIGGMAYAAATKDPSIVMLHQLYVQPGLQRTGLGACCCARSRTAFPKRGSSGLRLSRRMRRRRLLRAEWLCRGRQRRELRQARLPAFRR